MGKITAAMGEELKARVRSKGGTVEEQFLKAPKANPPDSKIQWTKVETAAEDRPKKPRMNKTETAWKAILDGRDFDKVVFEGVRLMLAPRVHYTPDFYCIEFLDATLPDGPKRVTFFESKGPYMRPDSWTKLKMAAHLYPEFIFILAQKQSKKNGGAWVETRVEA